MPDPMKSKRSPSFPLSLRVRIAVISLLSLLVTTACSWLRLRSVEEPSVTCYKVANPTSTLTPYAICYEASVPIDTPTSEHPALFPSPVCYTPTLSASHTPTPTLTPTPVCYTPTPSPTVAPPAPSLFLTPAQEPTITCYAPQADTGPLAPAATGFTTSIPAPAEARRMLLEKLLAKGRFPRDIARRLDG